ncbi:MAG: methylated-DNA--[protein]-cysteine S-methyltransferase [Methanobacteriota archaeon]|nr:MAG: methylated-DNA--[protein]-cysteine S-methyltransferase [Euryarchaeota archaeon]
MTFELLIRIDSIQTPVGLMVVGEFNEKCCLLEYQGRTSLPSILKKKEKLLKSQIIEKRVMLHDQIEKEIIEYFSGKRKNFEIPILLKGSPFQEKVWDTLCTIPYGETMTYSELAVKCGTPKSIRAVGAANGANNIAILIPCHRVVGKDGKLHGYGGGINVKRKLLALERSHSNQGSLSTFFG